MLAQRRIRAGDGFLSRYRQLMAPGAQLEVRASPPQPVNVAGLAGKAPEQLLEDLGLSFDVNGQAIANLDLSFNVEPPALLPTETEVPAVSVPAASQPAVSAARPDPSRSLTDTPVDRIGTYVGSQVVINTITGRLYQGYVDEVSPDGRIMLTIMQRGGSAQVPINIDQIERLRVFR